MDSTALRRLAVGGVACLLFLPHSRAFSATLRDEAVKYRTDGYERQEKGDVEGALTAYQKAAALDPAYPTPHNDVGVLLEEMGRFEEARQSYEKALAVDPNYLGAHANLAMLCERLGEKDKAIYHWLRRYQLGDPTDPWTARAEDRLAALGALPFPGLKGKAFTSRHVISQELKAHEQSLDDLHSLTKQHGRW